MMRGQEAVALLFDHIRESLAALVEQLVGEEDPDPALFLLEGKDAVVAPAPREFDVTSQLHKEVFIAGVGGHLVAKFDSPALAFVASSWTTKYPDGMRAKMSEYREKHGRYPTARTELEELGIARPSESPDRVEQVSVCVAARDGVMAFHSAPLMRSKGSVSLGEWTTLSYDPDKGDKVEGLIPDLLRIAFREVQDHPTTKE